MVKRAGAGVGRGGGGEGWGYERAERYEGEEGYDSPSRASWS